VFCANAGVVTAGASALIATTATVARSHAARFSLSPRPVRHATTLISTLSPFWRRAPRPTFQQQRRSTFRVFSAAMTIF